MLPQGNGLSKAPSLFWPRSSGSRWTFCQPGRQAMLSTRGDSVRAVAVVWLSPDRRNGAALANTAARIVTKPRQLETALATAQAALADTAINPVDVSAGWVGRKFKLDRVRAYCRELRIVFLELNPSATVPFRCDEPSCALLRSPRTTCWLNHLEGVIAADRRLETFASSLTRAGAPTPDQANHRFNNIAFPAQEPSPTDARVRPFLPRQTIDLLALILAYLLYFHIDVQLQIVSLLSSFP